MDKKYITYKYLIDGLIGSLYYDYRNCCELLDTLLNMCDQDFIDLLNDPDDVTQIDIIGYLIHEGKFRELEVLLSYVRPHVNFLELTLTPSDMYEHCVYMCGMSEIYITPLCKIQDTSRTLKLMREQLGNSIPASLFQLSEKRFEQVTQKYAKMIELMEADPEEVDKFVDIVKNFAQ